MKINHIIIKTFAHYDLLYIPTESFANDWVLTSPAEKWR